MHPLSPFFGIAVLSGLLAANYFRATWRLGILEAFVRRQPLHWRTRMAGTLAGCLPVTGALLALALVPTGEHGEVHSTAGHLALMLAGCGLAMHVINDALVAWGAPRATTRQR